MAKLASSSTLALDFLRRLLCAQSAGGEVRAARRRGTRGPAQLEQEPEPEPEGRSPCIVARLMGLDAMPPPPEAVEEPLRRSRSASSAEGWPPPPPSPARAPPKAAYLRQESDEFLVLSFSPGERERARRGLRDREDALLLELGSASDTDAAETRRGEGAPGSAAAAEQRSGNRRRRRRLRFSDEEAPSSPSASGSRRRRAAAAAAAVECEMENSSPVSVLEARYGHEDSSTTTTTTSSSLEEAEHAATATSEEAQFTLEQQCARSKLKADFNELDNASPARSNSHSSRCSDRERRNRTVVNKEEVIAPDVARIWQPVCRVVEEDIKNMEWLSRDGTNVVAAEMESGILDQLICEAVDELVQLWSDASPVTSSREAPPSRKCSGKTSNCKYPHPRNVQPRQAIGGY
ncbi:hypothetical protein ACP4OV_016521 [Aristida adscensionis]